MSINLLEPEEHIAERLRALQPETPEVLSDTDVMEIRRIATIGDVKEQSQKYRTIHVMYDGYRIDEDRDDGAIRLETRWLVVLAVRNASGHATKSGVRNDAGPILNRIIARLIGWKPTKAHSRLKLAPANPPGYTAAFGYFPLGFTTQTTFYPDEEISQ